MSTTPPESGTATVEIARSDIEVILEGLREMPNAVTQMAESIKVLADNTNRTPSRAYTVVIVTAAILVNLLVLGGALYVIRSAQNEGTKRGKDTNEVVKKVQDCIDILPESEDGTPQGVCAGAIISATGQVVADIRKDIRCESQVTIRDFVIQNPEFQVNPPTISPECEEYARTRN